MTNREKYEKEIMDIFWKSFDHPAVTVNDIERCTGVSCPRCILGGKGGCNEAFRKWLAQEYKEPEIDWTKVPVDTKILVRDDEYTNWIKRHFHSYSDGKIRAFCDGATSWSNPDDIRPLEWEYADIADPEERKKYLKND